MDGRRLTLSDGIKAVSIARDAILASFENRPVDFPDELPILFREERGLFVTLTMDGCLRGCIGFPYPVMSIEEALPKAAKAAAFDDPRFIPLSKADLGNVRIEVTVLTEPKLLDCDFRDYEKHIVIGKHGLIAVYPNARGLLLPQVATEYKVDAMEFLCMTAQKAGMPPMSWKYDARIYTFEGQIFSETEPKGKVIEQTYREKKDCAENDKNENKKNADENPAGKTKK
ncbi:TIGR00296 family protein [Methanosarcinaceae archaeon]|nr:TIGR00296 family protein [Methanosarcinaceae archaeon]